MPSEFTSKWMWKKTNLRETGCVLVEIVAGFSSLSPVLSALSPSLLPLLHTAPLPPASGKDAVKLMRKRMLHKNPNVALRTLEVRQPCGGRRKEKEEGGQRDKRK